MNSTIFMVLENFTGAFFLQKLSMFFLLEINQTLFLGKKKLKTHSSKFPQVEEFGGAELIIIGRLECMHFASWTLLILKRNTSHKQ